jgi:ATP phosphoribosyltransferase
MAVLSLGLPKGRVLKKTHALCKAIGIALRPRVLSYRANIAGHDLCVYFLKLQDIGRLLAADLLDLGVTGDEWLLEAGIPSNQRCAVFDWYQARLCLLTAKADHREFKQLHRLVTPYPRTAACLLMPIVPGAEILSVTGSTESLVPGIADGAIDLVETGNSAAANDLAIRLDFLGVTTRMARSRKCDQDLAVIIAAQLADCGI